MQVMHDTCIVHNLQPKQSIFVYVLTLALLILSFTSHGHYTCTVLVHGQSCSRKRKCKDVLPAVRATLRLVFRTQGNLMEVIQCASLHTNVYICAVYIVQTVIQFAYNNTKCTEYAHTVNMGSQ